MYHELTKKEISKFIRRYFNINDSYTKSIKNVSVIEYNGIKEYLINSQYMLRIYK